MTASTTRILIETTIRKAIKDISIDPERSIRRVVDMAANFSSGRFQKNFFSSAQKMLSNDQSAYYRLVRDTVANVNSEKLIQLGMNLGYNSCTIGAKTIREIEEAEHFNLPWSLSLDINADTLHNNKDFYQSLLSDGQTLGIFTWLLYADEISSDLLDMIAEFSDCAFLLFCPGEKITDALLTETEYLHNILYVVTYDNRVCSACARLRKARFPYAVYVPYSEQDVDSILNDSLFSNIENLRPIFIFLKADISCSRETQNRVYQYIKVLRTKQNHPALIMDLIYDNFFIDGIISSDARIAGFNAVGQFYTFDETSSGSNYNLHSNSLNNILKLAFPKASFQ